MHSDGIPRTINVIADAILLFGYGEEQRSISVDLTQDAIEELEATGVHTAGRSRPPGGTAASSQRFRRRRATKSCAPASCGWPNASASWPPSSGSSTRNTGC